jgi:hypothetical protein
MIDLQFIILLKHFFIFPKYHLIMRLIRYLIFQQLFLNVMMYYFLYFMIFIDFKMFNEIQYFKYLVNLMKNFINFKCIYYLLFIRCYHLYFKFINCLIIKKEYFSHFDHYDYDIGNWIEYLMKQFQGNYNQ